MELSDLVKKFVSEPENAEVLVDLTKASTEYISDFVLKKEYSKDLEKIGHYLKNIDELNGIDPDKFCTELVKYLYEHREK